MASLCATQSLQMLQHSAPVQLSNTFPYCQHHTCSNAVYSNSTPHILITHIPSLQYAPKIFASPLFYGKQYCK